jgi:CHAT domain-containing protein
LSQLHAALGEKVATRVARPRGFAVEELPVKKESLEEAVARLSDLLVPESFWPVLTKYQHIIIVPQLAMATVPFSLLKRPDGRFLAETASIWIAPKIRDVAAADGEFEPHSFNRRLRFTFRSPLVVGNPTFKPNDDWVFPPLPGAEAEAKAVAAIMGTRPLLGAEAKKETIAERARTSDLIYFATHGVALPRDALSGFLALAGAPDDAGRWSAKEIQALDFSKTDLAVLSACQTGLGGSHAGGVIGLARAFALAGVPWVVMSLWSVDDAATSELMQDFMRELQKCDTRQSCLPAVVLRSAMMKAKDHLEPQLWGSFVVFGVPSYYRPSANRGAE